MPEKYFHLLIYIYYINRFKHTLILIFLQLEHDFIQSGTIPEVGKMFADIISSQIFPLKNINLDNERRQTMRIVLFFNAHKMSEKTMLFV